MHRIVKGKKTTTELARVEEKHKKGVEKPGSPG